MARGEFKIAKQSALRGYFGKLSLDVEPTGLLNPASMGLNRCADASAGKRDELHSTPSGSEDCFLWRGGYNCALVRLESQP